MMMTHLPNKTISQSSSVHISVDTSTQHKKSLQDIHEDEASMYIICSCNHSSSSSMLKRMESMDQSLKRVMGKNFCGKKLLIVLYVNWCCMLLNMGFSGFTCKNSEEMWVLKIKSWLYILRSSWDCRRGNFVNWTSTTESSDGI